MTGEETEENWHLCTNALEGSYLETSYLRKFIFGQDKFRAPYSPFHLSATWKVTRVYKVGCFPVAL